MLSALIATTINYNRKRVLTIQGQQVLIDKDVAELYGVEVKRVNEAVRRNPDKFPAGYIIIPDSMDFDFSRSQIATLNESGRGHNIKYIPKAFTEKGLYMLATILDIKVNGFCTDDTQMS